MRSVQARARQRAQVAARGDPSIAQQAGGGRQAYAQMRMRRQRASVRQVRRAACAQCRCVQAERRV